MNCLTCQGACCEDFSLPMADAQIKTGDAVADDVNRWLALHAEEGDGYLRFECRCTKLTEDGRCGIYQDRPEVCRTYQAGGSSCLDAVRRRRTPEQYQQIREEGDPERIHGLPVGLMERILELAERRDG